MSDPIVTPFLEAGRSYIESWRPSSCIGSKRCFANRNIAGRLSNVSAGANAFAASSRPGYVFYVFDYNLMNGYYGRQAFKAIQAACTGIPTKGRCEFTDGDVESAVVHQMAGQAGLVPAGDSAPAQSAIAPRSVPI